MYILLDFIVSKAHISPCFNISEIGMCFMMTADHGGTCDIVLLFASVVHSCSTDIHKRSKGALSRDVKESYHRLTGSISSFLVARKVSVFNVAGI